MIFFECWYCGKSLCVANERVGQRLACTCGRRLKVPRTSHGASRAWTVGDFLIETLVYGGGGALLGFGLGVLVASRLPFFRRSGYIIGGLTLAGLLVGAVFGEAGINYVGRKIREREPR